MAQTRYIVCGDIRVLYHRLQRCESTQDVAREIAVEDIAAVSCDSMSKGRGRLGRRWFASKGGAWVTVSAKLASEAVHSIIPIAVGARLAEWLRGRYRVDVRVKWPNDLIIEDRKVGGILIEAIAGKEARILVGVGVNVTNDIPAKLRPYATRLADWVEDASAEEVVEGIICSVVSALNDVEARRNSILDLWRRLSSTLGREVWVILDDGELRGIAVDIDEDGALLVKTGDGIKRVLVGDVIHLRPVRLNFNE